MSAPKIRDFKEVRRNSLLGFAEIEMPSGLIFHDVAVHQRDGKRWASPASKPMIGRDGTQTRAATGKPQFAPIVSFASRERRDQFSQGVIEALRSQRPEMFRP